MPFHCDGRFPSIDGYNIVPNVAVNENNNRELQCFILPSPREENDTMKSLSLKVTYYL